MNHHFGLQCTCGPDGDEALRFMCLVHGPFAGEAKRLAEDIKSVKLVDYGNEIWISGSGYAKYPAFKPSIPPVTMTCGMCNTRYPGHEICPVCETWFRDTAGNGITMNDTRAIMRLVMETNNGVLSKVRWE